MATRQTRLPGTSAPSDGSRTITIQDNQPQQENHPNGDGSTIGTLRLRGVTRRRPRVIWREDVVDNEGAGKKKSKICCIYHKPRQFDESSSDESTDEDSNSDSDSGVRTRRQCNRGHDHDDHAEGAYGGAHREGNGGGVVDELESDDETNAYERGPRKYPKPGDNNTNNES